MRKYYRTQMSLEPTDFMQILMRQVYTVKCHSTYWLIIFNDFIEIHVRNYEAEMEVRKVLYIS